MIFKIHCSLFLCSTLVASTQVPKFSASPLRDVTGLDSNTVIAHDEYSHHDEGDIVFAHNSPHSHVSTQVAQADNLRLWPGRRMPLRVNFSSNDSYFVYEYVIEAMDMINAAACVRVDFWTMDDEDYVVVELSDSMGSSVGRQGGLQVLNVSYDVTNRGSVAHEMLHSLGFGHEHNRMDRDSYITVHFDNIRSQYWPYYTKYESGGDYVMDGLPYDYTSILHATAQVYPGVAVDVSKPLITRNDGQLDLGQRSYLTEMDVASLKLRYSCDVCQQPDSDDLLYKYPGDCTKYIQCSNSVEYVMECPEDLHISVQHQQCLYPREANCTIYF